VPSGAQAMDSGTDDDKACLIRHRHERLSIALAIKPHGNVARAKVVIEGFEAFFTAIA
jgi:hypothetical protein